MSNPLRLFIVFLALSFSNYIYQVFTERDWIAAWQRSYFQGIALFCGWLVLNR